MRKHPKNIVVWAVKKPDNVTFPDASRVSYANPSLWDGKMRPLNDAVYAPDFPHIEKAYKDNGKIVWRPEGSVTNDTLEKSIADIPVQNSKESAKDEEEEVETSWRGLPWPQLRSLATQFTDDPVKSKDQAKEILEQAETDGKL